MSEAMISANTALLSLKEKLQENLSSVQIARTLDGLLFKALTPLVQHSNYLEYTMVELLYHIFHNMRRKFSNRTHDDLRDSLFTLIVTKRKTGKTAEMRRLGLERSIYFKVLLTFEKDAQLYVDDMPKAMAAGQKTPAMIRIEKRYRAENSPGFYHACANTLFWCKRAIAFRNMIVEKFTRLAWVEAQKARAKTGLQISVDDLARNMLISIFKAIDKYDPEKGPLASYIVWWFQDAKNGETGHEEGVAYTIPLSLRKKLLSEGVVNIYAPIDDSVEHSADNTPSVLDRLMDEEEGQVLQNLICRIDREKQFSLFYGISYSLSEADKDRLRATLA